jgi:hypothetical protein
VRGYVAIGEHRVVVLAQHCAVGTHEQRAEGLLARVASPLGERERSPEVGLVRFGHDWVTTIRKAPILSAGCGGGHVGDSIDSRISAAPAGIALAPFRHVIEVPGGVFRIRLTAPGRVSGGIVQEYMSRAYD